MFNTKMTIQSTAELSPSVLNDKLHKRMYSLYALSQSIEQKSYLIFLLSPFTFHRLHDIRSSYMALFMKLEKRLGFTERNPTKNKGIDTGILDVI